MSQKCVHVQSETLTTGCAPLLTHSVCACARVTQSNSRKEPVKSNLTPSKPRFLILQILYAQQWWRNTHPNISSSSRSTCASCCRLRGRKHHERVTSYAHSNSSSSRKMIKTGLTTESPAHGSSADKLSRTGARVNPIQLRANWRAIPAHLDALLIHNANYILACQVPGHKTNFNGITCFLAAIHRRAQAHK